MTTGVKLISCAGVIFVWMYINYMVLQANGGGALTFIIMMGMIAAVRAIWKYKPEETSSTEDNHQLKKD
jgi:hypothetical protein